MEQNDSVDFEQAYAIQKRNFEDKVQNVKRWLLNKIPVFAALGIAIFWIFYGMVEIVDANLSIVDRIWLTVLTVAMAVIYCGLLAHTGFDSARQSDLYTKANEKYKEAQRKGIAKKKQVTRYAFEVAVVNLKNIRKENLEANGLQYDKIFNSKGELIALDYDRNKYHKTKNKFGYTRKQRKIIKKCVNITIILPDIFGTISNKFFGIGKEVSQKDYEKKSTIWNTVIRAFISAFSVGIMFNFVGISLGSMIYAFMQIVLWTSSAVSQRLNNYSFVTNKLVPQMEDKTLIINGYLDLPEEERLKYEDENYLKEEIKEEKVNGRQIPRIQPRPIR